MGEKTTLGVYIHIPFCKSKCPYCGFNSFAVSPIPERGYVSALLREFSCLLRTEELGERIQGVGTVYLGGGTPSLLSPPEAARLLNGIGRGLCIADGAEVTLETNPDTVDAGKLKGFKDAGINRLTIGVQSFNHQELKRLGRTHSEEKAERVFFEARDAGFKNIGIDLIFGIPGQTLKGWEGSISTAVKLRPEHLSIYNLTIEKGAGYYSAFKNKELQLPSEKEEAGMYIAALKIFKDNGYKHYEVSNLSLPGFESRHNTNYWLGKNYTGLGAGAHSYLAWPGWGRRWWNEKKPGRYMELVNTEGTARSGGERLSKDEAELEALMLGLRLVKGIKKSDFKKRFGKSPAGLLCREGLVDCGLIRNTGENIALTEKGILFSNEVF